MPSLLKILIVDDVAENRLLLTKTLLRKYPRAILQECESAEAALGAVRHDQLTVVVVHRAVEFDGVRLIALLRRANADIPIIMVSGRESCPEATLAGATTFLNYEAWLRIGSVVEDVLRARALPVAPAASPAAV